MALGANLGFARHTICQALALIQQHPLIQDFRSSSLYRTTPVSPLPQPDYINAVCCFVTSLSAESLFDFLQQLEKLLGKQAKHRDAPRSIDLDLLFYGHHTYHSEHLIVPHPRWQERLFVLRPLADLTDDFDIENKLRSFPNPNQEQVICVSKS